MKRLLYITILAAALFSSSCTDEVGGNANIQTVNFVVQNNEWLAYGNFGEPYYGYAVDLVMPQITENVIQQGMVSLYLKSGDAWLPVPIYFYNDGYQGGFYYRMKSGLFSIEYYESDHQTQNPDTQSFRLVIVEPI